MKSYKEDNRPSFQFYPEDWMSESSLKLCSLEAKGLWIEMLMIMFRSKRRGSLMVNGVTITSKELAKLVAEPEEKVIRLLDEMEKYNVFSKIENDLIINRRMYYAAEKERAIHEARVKAGRLGGLSKKAGDPKQNEANVIKEEAKEEQDQARETSKSTSKIIAKQAAPTPSPSPSSSPEPYTPPYIPPPRGGGTRSRRFIPPTREEVEVYAIEIGYLELLPDKFINHYKQKDWMVGKSKMKDWKAAIRNWKVNGWGKKNGKDQSKAETDTKWQGAYA